VDTLAWPAGHGERTPDWTPCPDGRTPERLGTRAPIASDTRVDTWNGHPRQPQAPATNGRGLLGRGLALGAAALTSTLRPAASRTVRTAPLLGVVWAGGRALTT
jgi:hypothetical protein